MMLPIKTEMFVEWAQSIFWADCSAPWPERRDGPWHVPPEWNERAALGALRNWLNEPTQTGVREELRDGLAQLGWDTPSAAGRRLLSELIWNTVLARFGITPALRSVHRSAMSEDGFAVHVIDADGPHNSDRSGWLVMVRLEDYGATAVRIAAEWVLNALLYYDVELGLADEPLYRRRYRKPKEWDPRPEERVSASTQPEAMGPPTCPKCGSPMVEKANGRTGRPFWSCSRYPDCTGTRNWRATVR